MVLGNTTLRVEMAETGLPVGYHHKPTGRSFEGAVPDAGTLVLNGVRAPWAEWGFTATGTAKAVEYRATHGPTKIALTFRYDLGETSLSFKILKVNDRGTPLRSLSWEGLPLLRCRGPEWRLFRDRFRKTPWDSATARGLWWKEYETSSVGASFPDDAAQRNVHACAFDDKLCCFVRSSYPILPLTTRLVESTSFPSRCDVVEIGLGEWRYHVRSVTAPLLEAEIVFLTDTNGDDKADECDYQLYLNRALPAPDPQYGSAIWYKIFCGAQGKVETNYTRCLEIIRRVSECSGGRPQIAYLVGWQYEGHDSGYPALDRLNNRLGTREELLELIRVAKDRYACTVSVHANVDDAYRQHPQWDEAVVCRDVDGSPMTWEVFNGKQSFHICHTKDVESGSAFKRLDEMLALVPVAGTLHLDAFRTTNYSWEKDGFIGEPEELFCGMLPILEHLGEKGIDVSTEGLNGMRIEPAGLFSALWHLGDAPPLLYHRKLYGGGRRPGPIAYAVGTAIDLDFTAGMLRDKPEQIADAVGMAAMLYQFMLEREMLECRMERDSAFARFADGVESRADASGLRVSWGETLIADNTSRFLPFEDRIYVYGTAGGTVKRKLPQSWLTSKLVSAVPLRVEDGWVTLQLRPRAPVIITR